MKKNNKTSVEQPVLFDIPPEKPKHTCLTCAHRQRWQCGGSIIQYCRIRKSNRTFNGLMKVQGKYPACPAYHPDSK